MKPKSTKILNDIKTLNSILQNRTQKNREGIFVRITFQLYNFIQVNYVILYKLKISIKKRF
jgi:hypothetical protein